MDINKIESLAAYLKALGKKDVSALSNEEVADWVRAGKAGKENEITLQNVTDPENADLFNKRKQTEYFKLLKTAITKGKSVVFWVADDGPVVQDDEDVTDPWADDEGLPKFFIE